MSIAVMKQALEQFKKTHYALISAGLLDQTLLNENFTAAESLRQAIEQAEQVKPVAWMYDWEAEGETVTNWLTTGMGELNAFARAIEAAHGIGAIIEKIGTTK